MEALTPTEVATLDRLRARFLDGTNAGGGYWRSEAELALYDATFAERIGWKWDAVLAELSARRWRPRSPRLCDFGCGSGVAGRRVLVQWDGWQGVTLADVSSLAMAYAARQAQTTFPALPVQTASAESLTTLPPGTLLLISHVINELSPAARTRLLNLARQADEVIWVEAGSHADSRALVAAREELRGHGFSVIAPCPQQGPCGMLAEENAQHWCHHFGRVPSAVFQDAGWAQFGKQLGIDLRSLPYSFLVLSRETAPAETVSLGEAELAGERMARVIGHPRETKGRMQLLTCDATGVRDLLLQKRDGPKFFKSLQKGRAEPLVRCRVEDGKLLPVEPPDEDEPEA